MAIRTIVYFSCLALFHFRRIGAGVFDAFPPFPPPPPPPPKLSFTSLGDFVWLSYPLLSLSPALKGLKLRTDQKYRYFGLCIGKTPYLFKEAFDQRQLHTFLGSAPPGVFGKKTRLRWKVHRKGFCPQQSEVTERLPKYDWHNNNEYDACIVESIVYWRYLGL